MRDIFAIAIQPRSQLHRSNFIIEVDDSAFYLFPPRIALPEVKIGEKILNKKSKRIKIPFRNYPGQMKSKWEGEKQLAHEHTNATTSTENDNDSEDMIK